MGKATPMATRKSRAVSPIPNQRITSGIISRCGIFLPILTLLSNSRAPQGKNPFTRPSTNPIPPPMAKPSRARRALMATSVMSVPAASNSQPARATAVGAGSTRAATIPAMDNACQTTTISAGTSHGVACRSAFCLRLAVVMPLASHPLTARLERRSLGAGDDLPAKGTEGRGAGSGRNRLRVHPEFGEYQLGEAVGLFQVRVTAENEGVDAELFVFPHPIRDGVLVTDESCACSAAHQSHAGPQVRADLQALPGSVVKRFHARLAVRVHTGKDLLRTGDGRVIDAADERLRVAPGFFLGFPHDDMQADAETHVAAFGLGQTTDRGDLFGNLIGRLAPRQIEIDMFGRDLLRCWGGATEIERRVGFLHPGDEQLAPPNIDVLPLEVDRLASQLLAPDGEELVGDVVALIVRDMQSITCQLHRIAAGDDIDQ